MQWDNILLATLIGGVVGQFLNTMFGKRETRELVGTVKGMAETLGAMKDELLLLGSEMKHAVDSIDKNDNDHEKMEDQLHLLDKRVTIIEDKIKLKK